MYARLIPKSVYVSTPSYADLTTCLENRLIVSFAGFSEHECILIPFHRSEKSTMKRCRSCGSDLMKRCSRHGIDEYLMSLGGLYPFKCRYCRQRSYAIVWMKCIAPLVCLLTLGVVGVGSLWFVRSKVSAAGSIAGARRPRPEVRKTGVGRWAMVDSGTVLDNQAIIRLTQTQISPRTLVKMIERTPCHYDMKPAAIIRMKENGVTDDVIYAMLNTLDQCYMDGDPGRVSPASVSDLVAPLQ